MLQNDNNSLYEIIFYYNRIKFLLYSFNFTLRNPLYPSNINPSPLFYFRG